MKVQTRIITAAGAGIVMAGFAAGPALASTHTVRPGDTLSGIAVSSGVSLTKVEAANHWLKNPNLIYVGQVVHVPDGRSGITPMAPAYYRLAASLVGLAGIFLLPESAPARRAAPAAAPALAGA